MSDIVHDWSHILIADKTSTRENRTAGCPAGTYWNDCIEKCPCTNGEFVNWMDLAYALKDLLDPSAQRKVRIWNSFSLTV